MRFTPRSSASWIVAMLSASSLSSYQLPARIPMHPRAMGNTDGPLLPRLRFVFVVTAAPPSGFEVRHFEVREESGMRRLPFEPLARPYAGRWVVELRESRQEAEVRSSLLGGNALRRDAKATADGLGDVAERDTLFGHPVKAHTSRHLLQREAVQTRGIERVQGGPAVGPVADVSGESVLARHRDKRRHEAVMVERAVHRGCEANHRGPHAAPG